MANLTTNIATVNICGIQSPAKISLLRQYLLQHHVDTALLKGVCVPAFNFFGYTEHVNVGSERRGTCPPPFTLSLIYTVEEV